MRFKLTKLLSRIVQYCHREDVVNYVSLAISKFHGQLRNLPTLQPPIISRWPLLSYKELRIQFRRLQTEQLAELYCALDEIFFG